MIAKYGIIHECHFIFHFCLNIDKHLLHNVVDGNTEQPPIKCLHIHRETSQGLCKRLSVYSTKAESLSMTNNEI